MLLFIVNGVVGIGESYLINVIWSLFGIFCVVIVIIGKVFYNINGCIIYLLLKFLVGLRGNKELIG